MAINHNLRRMTVGDKVVGGSLLLMLIAGFLPWISASLGNVPGIGDLGSISANGYHSWGFLYWFVTYVLIAFFVIRVLIPEMVPMPVLPVADSIIYMAGGVIAIIGAILYQNAGSFTAIGWGWYVALIAAAGLIAGGFLKQKDPAVTGHPSQLGSGRGGYDPTPPYSPGPGPSDTQRQFPAPQIPAQQAPPPYQPPQQQQPTQAPPQQPMPPQAPPQAPPPYQPPPQGPPPGSGPPPR